MSRPLYTVAAYGSSAGSTRVRIHDWVRHLRLSTVEHAYRGRADNRPGQLLRDLPGTLRAERAIRRVDVRGTRLLLSREATPFGAGAVEARLLRSADHGVYDFDDALFHDDAGYRRLFRRPERCRSAVGAADVVVAGNDDLADWAGHLSSAVVMVPSCVEPGDYQPRAEWAIGPRPRIVWLGSPSTEAYLVSLVPSLLEVHRRTRAELLVVSGPADNPALARLAPMMRREPWTPETFAALLATGDVGIAPLDDTPYSRGKCAYKLLQYAASALPVVGSPVGANALALSRFDGLAATTAGEWVDALTDVLEGPESGRANQGRTGLAAVHEHYAFAAWADVWRAAVLPD